MTKMTFDELNQLVGYKRSEDFETYFGSMDLTKSERQERIQLAEKLHEVFIDFVSLIFFMYQYGTTSPVEWQKAREMLYMAYVSAIEKNVEIDSETQARIRQLTHDLNDSTVRNVSDITDDSDKSLYFFSLDRARLLAEEETNTTLEYRDYKRAVTSGKKNKTWCDIRDRKERQSHLEVGGTTIPINEMFDLGDCYMRYPKDTVNGTAEQICNCRCHAKYS